MAAGPKNLEIERKFLVKKELIPAWLFNSASCLHFKQGYLSIGEVTSRVRIVNDSVAYFTAKSKQKGITREEIEFGIPIDKARELMTLCGTKTIEKTRRLLRLSDYMWEVDEFLGKHAGLWLAEIELPSENATFIKPVFVTDEVSTDIKYTNAWLATHEWNQKVLV